MKKRGHAAATCRACRPSARCARPEPRAAGARAIWWRSCSAVIPLRIRATLAQSSSLMQPDIISAAARANPLAKWPGRCRENRSIVAPLPWLPPLYRATAYNWTGEGHRPWSERRAAERDRGPSPFALANKRPRHRPLQTAWRLFGSAGRGRLARRAATDGQKVERRLPAKMSAITDRVALLRLRQIGQSVREWNDPPSTPAKPAICRAGQWSWCRRRLADDWRWANHIPTRALSRRWRHACSSRRAMRSRALGTLSNALLCTGARAAKFTNKKIVNHWPEAERQARAGGRGLLCSKANLNAAAPALGGPSPSALRSDDAPYFPRAEAGPT